MPFILINKEAGWTSHDVVGYLRKITRIKKIGHAGTLDPFATGLLIVGIGRDATKRLDEFKGMHKEYEATVRLGGVSTTYDKTGVIAESSLSKKIISLEEIQPVIQSFAGQQEQLPPMYSAKKINGEKLYTLARKGIEVERRPQLITIFDIQIVHYEYPYLKLKITCSTGTYIRTIAHDIGQKLGVGAYCEELKRTHIGEWSLKNSICVTEMTQENWKNQLFDPQGEVDKKPNI